MAQSFAPGETLPLEEFMTPAEMREVLLEEARWWANQPADTGSAHGWVTFFEQLPEDDPLLVMLSGEYQDADAFRNRYRVLRLNRFSVWNMFCNILQTSQGPAIPWRPDRPPERPREKL